MFKEITNKGEGYYGANLYHKSTNVTCSFFFVLVNKCFEIVFVSRTYSQNMKRKMFGIMTQNTDIIFL